MTHSVLWNVASSENRTLIKKCWFFAIVTSILKIICIQTLVQFNVGLWYLSFFKILWTDIALIPVCFPTSKGLILGFSVTCNKTAKSLSWFVCPKCHTKSLTPWRQEAVERRKKSFSLILKISWRKMCFPPCVCEKNLQRDWNILSPEKM